MARATNKFLLIVSYLFEKSTVRGFAVGNDAFRFTVYSVFALEEFVRINAFIYKFLNLCHGVGAILRIGNAEPAVIGAENRNGCSFLKFRIDHGRQQIFAL